MTSLTRSPLSLTRDNRGIAATEFALVAPILVLLFLGVVEISNLLIADTRMRATAASIADLITQDDDGTITSAEINIFNNVIAAIMYPVSFNGNLIVDMTDYMIDGTPPTASVRWRRHFAPDDPPTATGTLPCSGAGLPSTLITTTRNDVVRVDAQYIWTPAFALIFNAGVTLNTTNYNMPRFSLTMPLKVETPPQASGC